MPNKSDSVGKLHQYYTEVFLQKKSNCKNCNIQSPLTDENERKKYEHEVSFKDDQDSLEEIGNLTADYIVDKFNRNIKCVKDIGDSSCAGKINNTDDLEITFDDNTTQTLSLKCTKDNIKQILSKNMGARSLLKSYFNVDLEQKQFNCSLDAYHISFLQKVLNSNKNNIKELKEEINKHAKNNRLIKARFNSDRYKYMNYERDIFLNNIRNKLRYLLIHLDNKNLAHAYNLVLDTEKHHFIASYKKDNDKYIEKIKNTDTFNIDIRGNDSVIIKTKGYEIGFRYKFESGITSSIKLVGDYKKIQ